MNKFEQLIEFVINDDEQKARELFHDIVVEKSREIYENLMNEEEEDLDEADENEEDEEELDESFGDAGADASDNLINDVEADEESGMAEDEEEDSEFDDEAEEDGEDLTHDIEADHDEMGGEEDLEDRVVDLEDKLDELMAEFEAMMGGDEPAGDDVGDDMGGDALAVDDAEAIGASDDNGEEMTMEVSVRPMGEAVDLVAAPKPVTSEEGSINKKSTVAANAGAKGPIGNSVKPVSTGASQGGRHDAPGAYTNSTKELIGKVGNSPAQRTGQKLSPATKPHLAQATGVNIKSPLARG
jgi:hypothetical protein